METLHTEKIDFLKENPSIVLVFLLNEEKNQFELYGASDVAKKFFGVKEEEDKDIDIFSYWKNVFDESDLVRLFGYAEYLMRHKGESISFTCKLRNREDRVAGFVRTKYINNRLFAFCMFYKLSDLELLDQEFWSRSVPAHLVLEDVLTTTAYPIYWTDKQLRFLGTNKAMLDYFGYDNVQQLLGKTIFELNLLPKDIAEDVVRNQREGLKHIQPRKGERSIVVKGRAREISYIESPIVQDGNIVGLVGSFTDITEERLAQQQLRSMADMDYLTGLPNRRAFYSALDLEQKNGKAFTILMMDLDRFKQVNDQYGHEVGDDVLQESGKAIKRAVSVKGMVARWGGDEFIAYLLTTEEKSVRLVIETIEENISDIKELDGHQVDIGISIGYSTSGKLKSIEKIIDSADQKMYLTKRAKKESR